MDDSQTWPRNFGPKRLEDTEVSTESAASDRKLGMSYLPTGFNDVAHADQRLVFQLSRLVGSNIGLEFALDIFRFLAEHHLPRPKIPIPEWWVKR